MRDFFFIFLFFLPYILQGQNATIYGTIRDENSSGIEAANITIPYTNHGTISNSKGYYEFQIPAGQEIKINISFIGYHPFDTVVMLQPGDRMKLDKILHVNINEIQEVWISSSINKGTNLTRIEIKDFNVLPNATGNIESLLKTMPGVSSSNELSSQYSVRGGNFDENLVYVNGVEIYRPFLIRSGQQEGLSFVNPDMVKSIDFSAGGFEARYGDKMSSVLDIQYRTPNINAGSLSMSLLGGSAHIEGISMNKKFRHISGFRYKTTRYLLNSLDVKGNYKPSFYDFQTNLTYRFSEKFDFSFLGNYSANIYFLQPDDRETTFGPFNDAMNLKVYYEGQEIDQFNSFTGAFTSSFSPDQHNTYQLTFSTFQTYEKESFDILGFYSINQLDSRAGSENFGDSLYSIGNAGFYDHARNYLEAHIYTARLTGLHEYENNKINWGIKIQSEYIDDKISQWDVIDSTDYFTPYTGYMVMTTHSLKVENSLSSLRYNAFIQNTQKITKPNGEWFLTYGIRSSYWDYNHQILFSPRISMAYLPVWNTNISFFTSAGYYYQPPFYKEFRDAEGNLNQHILAQKSIHFIAGSDYVFSAWNRPFKLTSEIYYKHLDNLIPYKIDNVQIYYLGRNASHGFATGIEFKISGEFVKDAQSWASISIMTTREDIIGDFYFKDNVKIYPGYFVRPTNQYFSFSTFFQDYFPNNPEYKFHLTFFYGSPLPTSVPFSDRYDVIFKMRSYKRIDAGLSKSLERFSSGKFFKSIWLNAEILNIFGFENVSSIDWIKSVNSAYTQSGYYGVPNKLTGRRFNIKLTLNF